MASNGIKICYAILDFDSGKNVTPVQLRGFMAHLFTDVSEFHHHSDDSYHYPLIQYKRVDGKLSVVGIEQFADIVYDSMANFDHITTERQKIPLNNIELKNTIYHTQQELNEYKFSSPWIALNKKNYPMYKSLRKDEQKIFLERILIGNILSMLKGLKIFIDFKIVIKIKNFKTVTTTAHQNKFAGFFCQWESNVTLPDYLGLGKSVSKGFGVVTRVK
ncbi:MAG: CRISPR-associated endonuclease Cas6 [Nitrosotalea sp.]